MNQKGSVLVIVLFFILLALAVAAFWYFEANHSASEPTNSMGMATSTNSNQTSSVPNSNSSSSAENMVPLALRYAYVSSSSVILVSKDGSQKVLASYPTDETLWVGWSPDGKLLAVEHYNPNQMMGFYGAVESGLDVIATYPPYAVTKLVSPGKESQGTINWSPNDNFISFTTDAGSGYAGTNLEIINLQTGQPVFQTATATTTSWTGPLAWLDDNRFVYSLGPNAYIGISENPKQELLVSDVADLGCGTTDNSPIDWSSDQRFFTYYGNAGFTVFDSATGKKIVLGSPVTPSPAATGCGGPESSISRMGWFGDRYFYEDIPDGSTTPEGFPLNGSLKSISLPGGEITDYSGVDNDLNQTNNAGGWVVNGGLVLSADGKYAITGTWIYDLNNDKVACKVPSTGDDYWITTQDDDLGSSWEGGGVAALYGAHTGSDSQGNLLVHDQFISLFDISSCKEIGRLVFPTSTNPGGRDVGAVIDSSQMPTVSQMAQMIH